MAKVPFSSVGAATKIQALYAMSDAALLAQAAMIRSNFRIWINNNFILDASQQTYLTGVDNLFIDYIAQQLGMAIQHRLPITLNAPAASSETRINKLITCRVRPFAVEYDPAVGITAMGRVDFVVAYSSILV